MKFAVIADYDPNDPKLAEIRPVHRKYLAGLLEKGNLAISGPFTENGGALIVLEAGTKDEAEALMKADPFVQTGVFKTYAIHPWNPIFINRSLLPE